MEGTAGADSALARDPSPPSGPRPQRPGRRRVCMLTHSYYEEDARVRREAEALVAAGFAVDVYALRRPDDEARGELAGVAIRRLAVERHQGAGLGTYGAEYLRFFFLAAAAALGAHRRMRYGVVQVHTLPDFLVFAALPLRLSGSRVLLDLHEAMPEFFRSRFGGGRGVRYRLLRLAERLSIAAADEVVTVNAALADRLTGLGVDPRRVSVVLNSPDLRLFDPARSPTRPFMADGELHLVYAGALTPTYELEVVIDALAAIRARRPGLPVRLDLYGRGDAEPMLRERADTAGVSEQVTLHGRIPLDAVPAAIAAADCGIAPTRRDPFTEMSLSTKIFEYAAMGKPVVASRLPTLERYFPPDTVAGYAAGDPGALADAVLALVDDAAERIGRAARTAARAAELSWTEEARRYVALVERLAQG